MINNPGSSRELIIFLISFISSFKIINFVHFAKSEERARDPNIFLWIAASVTDAATANPNGVRTILTNGWITFHFLLKGNPGFSNGP